MPKYLTIFETLKCLQPIIFETAYLGENAINLLHPKVAQNVAISLGYFIFSKNHNEPPKVAQLVKNRKIWSLCKGLTWLLPTPTDPFSFSPPDRPTTATESSRAGPELADESPRRRVNPEKETVGMSRRKQCCP